MQEASPHIVPWWKREGKNAADRLLECGVIVNDTRVVHADFDKYLPSNLKYNTYTYTQFPNTSAQAEAIGS